MSRPGAKQTRQEQTNRGRQGQQNQPHLDFDPLLTEHKHPTNGREKYPPRCGGCVYHFSEIFCGICVDNTDNICVDMEKLNISSIFGSTILFQDKREKLKCKILNNSPFKFKINLNT